MDTGNALGLAVWVEGGLRTLLRDAALGDLGGEISVAADETLITSGLEAGEGSPGQMGSTDEWDIPEPSEISISHSPDIGAEEPQQEGSDPAAPGGEAEEAAGMDSDATRIIEPIPTAEDEIRVTALNAPAAGEPGEEEETEKPRSRADWGFEDDDQEESPMSDRDWLSEVSREERTTLEWPAGEGSDPRERERIDTPRVGTCSRCPRTRTGRCASWSTTAAAPHRVS